MRRIDRGPAAEGACKHLQNLALRQTPHCQCCTLHFWALTCCNLKQPDTALHWTEVTPGPNPVAVLQTHAHVPRKMGQTPLPKRERKHACGLYGLILFGHTGYPLPLLWHYPGTLLVRRRCCSF